jgi:hypothetical protein
VNRKARRWAAAAALLLLVAGGALAFGQVTGTFAIFTAETQNSSGVAVGSWIPTPSGATSALPTTSPYSTLSLAWTSGNSAATPTPNPVTGQSILYADGGSGASASCGSYSAFSTTTAAATTATPTGTNLTDWWCFEVQSTSTSATTSGSWTSDVATFTPRRILVPTTVVIANGGGTANRIDNGDTITITFNQPVNLPGGTQRICAVNTGVLILGDSTGACAAGDAYTIARITGLTISRTLTGNGLSETVSQPTTSEIKVQVTSSPGTNTNVTGVTSSTLVASASVTAVTGSVPACNSTSAPNCAPTPSGAF